MELETFALRDKEKYQSFWDRVTAKNDHLTKESGRVQWILGAVMSVKPNLILEIGCQTGGVTRYLLEIAMIVRAVDIVQRNLQAAEGMGASTLLAFAEDLHLHSIGQYDSVVLTEVLSLVMDAEKVVANCWAKVAPGGNLVVTVPVGDRWTDQGTAREFNEPDDLAAILLMGTGYSRVRVETLSHEGEDYFYVCNLKKRKRRGT